VKAYQAANDLEVDGIVGRQTAQTMGIWAGPLGPLPATDADCPDTAHAAIVDRANQRGWLCDNGTLTKEFPITTAMREPSARLGVVDRRGSRTIDADRGVAAGHGQVARGAPVRSRA